MDYSVGGQKCSTIDYSENQLKEVKYFWSGNRSWGIASSDTIFPCAKIVNSVPYLTPLICRVWWLLPSWCIGCGTSGLAYKTPTREFDAIPETFRFLVYAFLQTYCERTCWTGNPVRRWRNEIYEELCLPLRQITWLWTILRRPV